MHGLLSLLQCWQSTWWQLTKLTASISLGMLTGFSHTFFFCGPQLNVVFSAQKMQFCQFYKLVGWKLMIFWILLAFPCNMCQQPRLIVSLKSKQLHTNMLQDIHLKIFLKLSITTYFIYRLLEDRLHHGENWEWKVGRTFRASAKGCGNVECHMLSGAFVQQINWWVKSGNVDLLIVTCYWFV